MFEIDRTVSMNYGETTKMVVESVKHFSEQYIRPHVMDWDESQFFPATVLRKAGELGFMGLLIPEIYGGSGMGYKNRKTRKSSQHINEIKNGTL